MAVQVDYRIVPSDQFTVYNPDTKSNKTITYFTLLSKLRGDILAVGGEDDIVSAFYTNTGGTQTLHLVKADGSEITASQAQQVISGTLNFVSKFTSPNDIGDSQIFDDGTNVGIGTTTMNHKLELGTGGVFADYFQLDTTYSNGFVVGAISWDSDNGTADIGLSGSLKLKIGQDDVWYVKNQTGSPITKGTAVYASGTLGASSKILITPMIANGTIPAKFFLGIVAETIANGSEGYVLTKGKLRNINTLAYNEGDVLWVSPTTAGALTSTEPTAPNLKLPVAFVVSKKNNGVLAVRATTGQRIADASDVDYTGAADNSFLVYDLASGVWVDEAVGIFKTIAVSGQDNVVADSYTDTLTLVAGSSTTITTNGDTDSITISSSDTLDSVTGRGATTTNAITVGGLTATSSSNSVDVLRIGNTASDSGSVQGFTHLAINHFSAGTYPSTRITAYQDGVSGWNGGMYFSTRELNTDSAPLERMRITSAGNVGIGTTSPSTKLYVAGDALIEDAATFNTSVKLGGNLLTDVQEFTHTEASENDIAEESYIILNKFGTGSGTGFLYLPSVSSFSTYTPTYRLLAASSIDASHSVRIFPSSSDTGVYINGANYIDLNTSYSVKSLVLADGQWYVIDSK